MNTSVQIFNFNQSNVRVQTVNHEPFFCLKDVAEILEIKDTKAKNFNLKADGVENFPLIDSMGRKQEATFINEPNLYRVIFRSRKAEAVKFQDWIFEEVIPQIRKTGGYQVGQKTTADDRTGLRQAVAALVGRKGIDYSSAYSMIHQRFGVAHIDQIAAPLLPVAVAYVHSLTLQNGLNGEVLDRLPENMQPQPLRNLQSAVINSLYCAEFIYQHRQAIRGLNRRLAATLHDRATNSIIFLRNVAEQAGIRVPDDEYFQYFPWDGDNEEKARYHQLNA